MLEMWSSTKESKTQHFMVNDTTLMDMEQRTKVTKTIYEKLTTLCTEEGETGKNIEALRTHCIIQ